MSLAQVSSRCSGGLSGPRLRVAAAHGGGRADPSSQTRIHAHGAAERPDGGLPRGSFDADRPSAALVSRRLEGRETRTHRVRAPVRAHDVPGQPERVARLARLDDRVGRRREQRLHDRRRDGLLGNSAGAVSAARVVARSRSDGVARRERREVQTANATSSKKNGASATKTSRSGGLPELISQRVHDGPVHTR